jgi:uncharacterized protein YlzI (FlbEa/FlbD family)
MMKIIELTQKLYEVSERAEQKIKDMSEAYLESVDMAEISGMKVPTPPTYKMKEEDYNIVERPLFLNVEDIESISQTFEGDTILISCIAREYILKETPQEVYDKIKQL